MGCAAARVLPLRGWRLHLPLPAWPGDRLRGNALLCPAVRPDLGGAGGPANPACLFPAVYILWTQSSSSLGHGCSAPPPQGRGGGRVGVRNPPPPQCHCSPNLPGHLCPARGWAPGHAACVCANMLGVLGREAAQPHPGSGACRKHGFPEYLPGVYKHSLCLGALAMGSAGFESLLSFTCSLLLAK